MNRLAWPEKRAGKTKYRVRRSPVVHLIDSYNVATGRVFAVCCRNGCRPRHDDGFTKDATKVTCWRCNKETP